jgi:hypothetical protein
MCRIGGSLGSGGASRRGGALEIPPLRSPTPNRGPLSGPETVRGGRFDWGGRLPKSNGGARRWAQAGRKSAVERNGTSLPDCERDGASRDESRP